MRETAFILALRHILRRSNLFLVAYQNRLVPSIGRGVSEMTGEVILAVICNLTLRAKQILLISLSSCVAIQNLWLFVIRQMHINLSAGCFESLIICLVAHHFRCLFKFFLITQSSRLLV